MEHGPQQRAAVAAACFLFVEECSELHICNADGLVDGIVDAHCDVDLRL